MVWLICQWFSLDTVLMLTGHENHTLVQLEMPDDKHGRTWCNRQQAEAVHSYIRHPHHDMPGCTVSVWVMAVDNRVTALRVLMA
eukprot:jgi/Chrzof1/7314/Cz02g19030.t1